MRPLVVCVASLKGGTGKTTAAVLLAATMHRQEHRVIVIDSDPQRSASQWRTANVHDVEADASANLPTVVAVEGAAIRATVVDMARTYDVILIDTPARLASETRRALLAAGDFGGAVLVPLSASGVDLRATVSTAALVREAQDFRPKLVSVLLRNRWRSRLRIARDVEATLEDLGIQVLDTTLAQRTAYAEAVSHGLAIEDTSDTRARAELTCLASELATCVRRMG